MARTILVSNGVGQPMSVQSSPMQWSRVSTPFLLLFLDGPPPWYSQAQIATAQRELNKRADQEAAEGEER